MRDIIGYEGLYKITADGNVYSVRNNIFLKLNQKKNGYVYVELNKNGNAKTFRVHRLVALAYVLNPESKEYVNHIDGIKNNNNYNNLEWVTASENNVHSYENNLQLPRLNKYRIYKSGAFICECDGNVKACEIIGVKSQATLKKIVDSKKESKKGYSVELIERSTTIPKGSRE